MKFNNTGQGWNRRPSDGWTAALPAEPRHPLTPSEARIYLIFSSHSPGIKVFKLSSTYLNLNLYTLQL